MIWGYWDHLWGWKGLGPCLLVHIPVDGAVVEFLPSIKCWVWSPTMQEKMLARSQSQKLGNKSLCLGANRDGFGECPFHSAAVINWPKAPQRRKIFNWYFQTIVHRLGISKQELEAKTVKEHWLQAPSLASAQLTLSYNSGSPAHGMTIKAMSQRLACGPVYPKQSLNWDSLGWQWRLTRTVTM